MATAGCEGRNGAGGTKEKEADSKLPAKKTRRMFDKATPSKDRK